MKIVCFVTASKSYLFAIDACVRRIKAALYHARKRRDIEFELVLVSDREGVELCHERGFDHRIASDVKEGAVRYKEEAQILIANLQQVGLAYAIESNADLCWSVESDVLVPHNALSCSLDMLDFDDGHYDVSFVTYPSQSGGMFLGGNGSPCHPIERDYLPHERNVPDEMMSRHTELDKWLQSPPDGFDEQERAAKLKEIQDINAEIEKCPPKGNIFALNSEKWRRRGWLDNAYPAIGRGAVLPTDWTGMGCTLMSRRALACAAFDGYDGRGTQDLFLNQRRWKSQGLNFCAITHTVCEHVVAKNDDEGRRVHAFAHHEPEGECQGHLRIQHRPFYQFNGSDRYDEGNNGVINPPPSKDVDNLT